MQKTAVRKFSDFYNEGWQNWNEFARYYPASIHRRRFILDEISKVNDWQSVADFGCGNALLIYSIYEKYAQEGKYFYGFDVSPEQIAKNKELFPGIEFESLDISEESSKRKFDIITCSEVIEHIPDYKAAMRNIVDSLNPGGTCIVTVPKGEIFYTEQTFGHIRHFMEEDLSDVFEEMGLITKKCHAWGFPFHDISKFIANINPKKTLADFASNNKLSSSSKMIFRIVNFFYYLNVLPMGRQLYYVGYKPKV